MKWIIFSSVGICLFLMLLPNTQRTFAQDRNHSKELNVIQLNRIIGLHKDQEHRRIEVTADRSGRLWLDSSTLDRYSLKIISAAESEKGLIVLEFDPDNREITDAFIPIVDAIVFLSRPEKDTEAVSVTAMKRPTGLFLRKDNPEFNTLYSILAKAFAQHREGWRAALAVPVGSQAIADVVLIPPVGRN